MSNNKRGGGADATYSAHLQGRPFNNNPTNDRLHVMTTMYIRLLSELAANRFKWSGMPDSIDVRFLEMTLFRRALAVFYFDKDYDRHFALEGASTAFVNMQHNPTAFTVVGPNFVSKTLGAFKEYKDGDQKDKAVPIWSNYMRIPDLDIVHVYATRLAEMDLTIEINSKNARRNKVILTPDNVRLSAVNVNRMADEGQNGIQINANGPMQDMQWMQAIDMGINVDYIEKLHIVRTRMWNECMGLLGIDNANQDKKERLVASEVDANNEQSSMMRYVNLNERRTACERINRCFGLNVSVEYFTDEDREVTTGTEMVDSD